jgi:hypothetical protein
MIRIIGHILVLAVIGWVIGTFFLACSTKPVVDKCPCAHDHKTDVFDCPCFWEGQ